MDKPNKTSLSTGPETGLGQLLRQAAAYMPTVQVGTRGWVIRVIERALTEFVEHRQSCKEQP